MRSILILVGSSFGMYRHKRKWSPNLYPARWNRYVLHRFCRSLRQCRGSSLQRVRDCTKRVKELAKLVKRYGNVFVRRNTILPGTKPLIGKLDTASHSESIVLQGCLNHSGRIVRKCTNRRTMDR